MAIWPMTTPQIEPIAPPMTPSRAASASMSATMVRRRPPSARIVEMMGRRCAMAMLIAL